MKAASSSRLPAPGNPLLAILLDRLPDAVLLLDADGRVQWGNVAAERLFGRKRGESIGISALEFVHDGDLELVHRSLASVQEKDVGTLIEVRVATPAGWKLVEVLGRPIPEVGQGSILFCIRDVTERRRFEVARDDVAKFRSIVQNAALVMMLVSDAGVIESASAALPRLFGHDPESVEGSQLQELFAPEDRVRLELGLKDASKGGRSLGPVTVEAEFRPRASADTVPVELTIVSLLEDPTVRGFVVSMRDISERVHAERELRETLSLLTGTLESTTDGIFMVDGQGIILNYNRRLAELWGIPDEVIASRDGARVRSLMAAALADPGAFLAKVEELDATPEAESFDTLECRDGRVLECYSRPQRVDDRIGGRVWSFRDVTGRKQLEEALAYRASHDHLTGLANREAFLEQLQRAAARSGRGRTAALLFLDVDGLKLVNDRLGHVAGDRLLVEVAEVLQSTTRAYDVVGRLGGDEFGVLIEDPPNPKYVVAMAERLLADMPMQFTDGEGSVQVSVSVGIAFAMSGVSHLDLLRQADVAMYSAKQQGGGRWELSAELRPRIGI